MPKILQNNSSQDSIVQCVRRWGQASSDAVIDDTNEIFELPHLDGLIGYRKEGRCVIVFGDPVCSNETLSELTEAFHQTMEKDGYSIIYISVSKSFVNRAIGTTCQSAIHFGEELIIDPHHDPRKRQGENASLVRRKVRHALHEGTVVKEYIDHDPQIEQEIELVGKTWLQSREGPQVYISHVHIFNNRFGKRWFYALQKGRMMGVIILNRLDVKEGWLMNHLMIRPDVSHGTPELLVVSALEILANEGCHYVTLGSVPAPRLGDMIGLKRSLSMGSPKYLSPSG